MLLFLMASKPRFWPQVSFHVDHLQPTCMKLNWTTVYSWQQQNITHRPQNYTDWKGLGWYQDKGSNGKRFKWNKKCSNAICFLLQYISGDPSPLWLKSYKLCLFYFWLTNSFCQKSSFKFKTLTWWNKPMRIVLEVSSSI